MAKDEQWITVQEAVRRLGVKKDAIRKGIQRPAVCGAFWAKAAPAAL